MIDARSLGTIPAWFGTAIIGALLAMFSYAAKSLLQWRAEVRAARAAKLAALLQLASLLKASSTLFKVQRLQAERLMQLVGVSHAPGEPGGFEQVFSRYYDQFTPEQLELHGVIRSYTEEALRPVNKAMLDWLSKDLTFKTGFSDAPKRKRAALGEKLYVLECHLILWEAKFKAWIPGSPKHALVYLADEEKHGIAFPSGIDELVRETVAALSSSAPKIGTPAVSKPV